ncbi:osiris 8 [Haematobia irritans]|uniref:osiris 8 n=1 Tax=Haematobia irritans TaxID=7368 RepID=UPI003F503775
MLKYVWHVAVVTIIFCWIQNSLARSASSSSAHTYQHANSVAEDPESPSQASHSNSAANSANVWKDLSMVYRLYQQCAAENLSVCLKVKLLTGLEKVQRSAKTLKIMEGIQFVKADDTVEPAKPLMTETDIEANLPRALDAKEQVLTNMIVKNIAGFLQRHTLQIRFPDLRPDDSILGNTVEGRKKKDKKGGGAYIMIPLLLGGTFVPIAYGALAMLAGKALIVSKLALVLASIIGIKKLLSSGGKESSHEVVVSSGGHSGWGRDFDLAYSAWKPHKDSKKTR